MLHAYAIVACLLLLACSVAGSARPRRELRNGRLYVGGVWTFLKLAVPLRNFAVAADVDRLIADWSPKPLIAEVDDRWPRWLDEIAQAGRVRP